MADNLLFQAPFKLTQGGADTSVEVQVLTGLLPGVDLTAWGLVGAELQMSANTLKGLAAADCYFAVQVTKRSLSGSIVLLDYSDNDLVTQFQVANILTGAGTSAQAMPVSWWWDFPPGAICYAPALYLQLISAATGLTNVGWGRLFYVPQKLSQAEALAVVAARA